MRDRPAKQDRRKRNNIGESWKEVIKGRHVLTSVRQHSQTYYQLEVFTSPCTPHCLKGSVKILNVSRSDDAIVYKHRSASTFTTWLPLLDGANRGTTHKIKMAYGEHNKLGEELNMLASTPAYDHSERRHMSWDVSDLCSRISRQPGASAERGCKQIQVQLLCVRCYDFKYIDGEIQGTNLHPNMYGLINTCEPKLWFGSRPLSNKLKDICNIYIYIYICVCVCVSVSLGSSVDPHGAS